MAIQNCGECGGIVSAVAKICPHCGHPRAPVQLIEQTSKKYKTTMAVGAAISVAGAVIFLAGAIDHATEISVVGGCIIVGGITLYAIGHIRAWWHHG